MNADLPITINGTWCSPDCQYLETVEVCGEDVPARCKKLNIDLDFYDYWLASCVEEQQPTTKETNEPSHG